MAKRNRRQSDEFNVSFLDVICCGFGALVLLLMISRNSPPGALEESDLQLDGQLAKLQQQLFEIRGETTVLNRQLNAKQQQLDSEKQRIAILKSRQLQLQQRYQNLSSSSQGQASLKGQLELALQQLSAEMQRLQQQDQENKNSLVGGIPVDSEYIIFIIDTSGSMFNFAWPKMLNQMIATLDVYPKVKGIQVMNDMGQFMFNSYAGDWIPDTAGRRKAIINRLRSWNPYSNSSPVEGIEKAIRSYYDRSKKISLYVFGDDFSGGSIRRVITTVRRLNAANQKGDRLVRIHAIGFPVMLDQRNANPTSALRFAALMRELSGENGGTFVGLNSYR